MSRLIEMSEIDSWISVNWMICMSSPVGGFD